MYHRISIDYNLKSKNHFYVIAQFTYYAELLALHTCLPTCMAYKYAKSSGLKPIKRIHQNQANKKNTPTHMHMPTNTPKQHHRAICGILLIDIFHKLIQQTIQLDYIKCISKLISNQHFAYFVFYRICSTNLNVHKDAVGGHVVERGGEEGWSKGRE